MKANAKKDCRQHIVQDLHDAMICIEQTQERTEPQSGLWNQLNAIWEEIDSLADSIEEDKENHYTDDFRE